MSLTTTITASVVAPASLPKAVFVSDPAFGVIGSVVKLDARQSSDPDGLALTYTWRFISVPIGSQVRGEGFRALDIETDTNSPVVVSFSPDVVGEYVIGLVVSNGVFSSAEIQNTVRIRAILVPHGRGIVPDGKFIWSYIRDVWSQVDGKEFFETLWSALIQIVGTEMLKLYQVDFNKSIRDIQDRYQRRWLAYEPKLPLVEGDLSFYFGNQIAGQTASTVNLGLEGLGIILDSGDLIVIQGAILQNVIGETLTINYSIDPSNTGTHELAGLNSDRTGYHLKTADLNPTADRIVTGIQWAFDIGSVSWEAIVGDVSSVKKGDVIHIPVGPNTGFYRISEKSGSFVTVDRAPTSSSTVTTAVATSVYRPVGYTVTQPAQATTDTFTVPYDSSADLSAVAIGRVVVVNGQAFTITRSSVDFTQNPPLVVVTVDSSSALAGLRGLNWRVPNTLKSGSQDFESLGVSTGDLLLIDVVRVDNGATSSIKAQIVGVHGDAVGFVVTDEEIPAGVVPPIPNDTIIKIASDLGIDEVRVGTDGQLVYTETALSYKNSISSSTFKNGYWNKELTTDSTISVNPLFQLKPKYIVRNKLIPVDENLRSIPALQEWITQPTLSEVNGKIYQIVRGKSFELQRKPVILSENIDYLIDNETVFTGQVTINTGSVDVEIDDADFVDRGMASGDSFIINAPLTLAGSYLIERVVSNTKIRLTRPVPAYVLGEFATANITLKRKSTGHFLRFVPGLFTAQNPAPDRLWAEASLFDNDQVIEDNFGILVGLKRESLDKVSRDINYRQAVSGLMFAFTRGSAIDKVRLGAQILLGLPFAEHRGIVRSIEEDYRLDINGEPILGRLLVEDIDSTGKPLGTLRIYVYPIDLASALAGIDVNPATRKPYVVGDIVELFAPLSKGVEIIDYLTNPGDVSPSPIAQLQKYHSIKLRANDNIFSLDELDLVSDFLRKITPSYIAYSLVTATEEADVVSITDLLRFSMTFGEDGVLVDNASLGLPPTMMFDSRSADGANQITWEDGVISVRRTGTDLVMTDGSLTISSAAGGFLDPKANEEFEGPLVIPGDILVVLGGINKGVYEISAIPTTNQLTVTGPAFGFENETEIPFVIGRRVGGPLSSGAATAVSGNPTATLGGAPQLRTRGVAAGDWLILENGGNLGVRYLITSVDESSPGSGVWNKVNVTPAPSFSGPATYEIYRPSWIPSDRTFTVTSSGGPTLLPFTGSSVISGLLEIGDELITDLPSLQRVVVLDPTNLFVTPVLPAGSYNVKIAKKNRPSTIIGWDHIEKFDPIDSVDVSLNSVSGSANCSGSTVQFNV